MRSSVPSTFSIVGFDPKTKDLGVAVESRFVAVGAVVPFAQAGVGAVATQSYANTTFGPKALGMMKQRVAPKDVLQRLVKAIRRPPGARWASSTSEVGSPSM